MAKLVDVIKENQILHRSQLPLVIDENLTMVLDLTNLNLVGVNCSIRGKQLEDFLRKYTFLTYKEAVSDAFQVTYKNLLEILDQTIPCIGCRKSVERVYMELSQSGNPTLCPLVFQSDGILTITCDYFQWPKHLCSLLKGHSTKLSSLASSWPRSKKISRRCILHSLDTQRYTRPMTSAGWRDVWDCMRNVCKEQVVLIESCVLLETLETYLRKHRFCGECRTKVMKAYTLLVEEKDPSKEKGYVANLYFGIKRCLADKHIHLDLRTDFIAGLISRAEPELIGNRRERHAKTLEIAQEEVLTCIGICVYERLHKIQMKLKEEQSTMQLLATVAIEALVRNFETVVEEKRGVSQLEICYYDMMKDDLMKQQRRELKKLKKRKRREERKMQLMKLMEKENEECECGEVVAEDEEHVCDEQVQPVDEQLLIKSSKSKKSANRKTNNKVMNNNINNNNNINHNNAVGNSGKTSTKLKRKSYNEKKNESVDTDDNCVCDDCCKEKSNLKNKKVIQKNFTINKSLSEPNTTLSVQPVSPQSKNKKKEIKKSLKKSKTSGEVTTREVCNHMLHSNISDGGYNSGNNSTLSSPASSEVACSDGFCNHEGPEECSMDSSIFNQKLSLEEMLSSSNDDDIDGDNDCIPIEEVEKFKAKKQNVDEARQQLRQVLQQRFLNMCNKSKLQIYP